MQCIQCKRELDDNSRYCPYCGTKIEVKGITVNNNTNKGEKEAVGLKLIDAYEGLVNLVGVIYAIIGFAIGLLFHLIMGSESTGIIAVVGLICGAIIGTIKIMPIKVMLVTARNVYTMTDIAIATERRMKEQKEQKQEKKEQKE